MPRLSFRIDESMAAPLSLAPAIVLKLSIGAQDQSQPIHSIALRCQIQIEAGRRRYNAEEQDRLLDLYGEPSRWSQTLRPMLWTHVSTIVPPFEGKTVTDLLLPCSFDFNIAATKYFSGLRNGDVPLCLLFSGTVFYEGVDGRLQVEQIPWDSETSYRLPIAVWQDMMKLHYGNQNWLSLRSDVFDQIYEYKRRNGIPTWEQAIESLLSLGEPQKRTKVTKTFA